MLSRIRALLAKAESTEFTEEAEALSARAQELMAKYSIDHALLAAEAGRKDDPAGRRLPVDNPYEGPKATAARRAWRKANRCRAVWYEGAWGWSAVIGFPADLDAVELLFTSLLVQANTAMLRAGAKRDRYGRSRTRAFRQSFLIVLRHPDRGAAARGGRPRRAGGGGRAAARSRPRRGARGRRIWCRARGAAPGRRRRGRRDVRRRRSTGAGPVRVSDAEGWYSGRAAADLATLRSNARVAG